MSSTSRRWRAAVTFRRSSSQSCGWMISARSPASLDRPDRRARTDLSHSTLGRQTTDFQLTGVFLMTPPRAIAAAQTCPAKGDVAANLCEHLMLVDLAASKGAQVVVFPELSLTGYEIELAPQLVFSDPDSRLEPLIALAASRSMTVVAGAPVRIAGRLHIGAFVLRPGRD